MNEHRGTLRKHLIEARENLALILERKAEYVLRTDIPLQLIKEERRLTRHIRDLEDQIDQARPITLLREATKLLTERVARAVDGMPWKSLKQRLLTQASKSPMERHLDVAALQRAADDMARLNSETKVLLEALRIRENPGQLQAVEQHAALIARHMLATYRLAPGEAPQLDRLASRISENGRRGHAGWRRIQGDPQGETALSAWLEDLSQQSRAIHDKLDRLLEGHKGLREGQIAIYRHLDDAQRETVTQLLTGLQQARLDDVQATRELRGTLDAVRRALIHLQTEQLADLSTELRQALDEVTEILRADADLRTGLELTIPLIPLLLSYKATLEAGAGPDLRQAWEDLIGWTKRQQ